MKATFKRAAALAVSTLAAARLLGADFNVADFGAKGDGESDDSDAIRQAAAKVAEAGGGALYFPHGVYRVAKQADGAICFKGVSNVSIRFAPGAMLLMDNLKKGGKEDGYGGGHGVVITGPSRNVSLENVYVKWKERPSRRSRGDAFRFEGFPSDDKTIANIAMSNCRGEGSPQTGAVFMGCSDVSVSNFSPVDTLADGLHFNACRRVNVCGLRGLNNGDDTLAFVTYYKAGAKISGGGQEPKHGGVFAFDELNEWCNSNSNAVNIISEDGHADGMRIGGGLNINVSNLTVKRKGFGGVQVDAAQQDDDPKLRRVGWSYLASRGISLSNIAISECVDGFVVRMLNVPPDAAPERWLFDLRVSNMSVTNCKKLGVDIQNAAGVAIDGLRTNSKVRLLNARGKCSLSNAEIDNADLSVQWVQGRKFQGFNKSNLEPLPVKPISLEEVETGNLELSRVSVNSGTLLIEGLGGLYADRLSVKGKAKLTLLKDCVFNDFTVKGSEPLTAPLELQSCGQLKFSRSCSETPERSQLMTVDAAQKDAKAFFEGPQGGR